jgi:hypothetical protein
MILQDVVVVLAPFPNNPNPVDEFDVVRDFDLKGDGLVWYALPQLFQRYPLPSGRKATCTRPQGDVQGGEEKETQQGGSSQKACRVMRQYFLMSHKMSHMISQTMIS